MHLVIDTWSLRFWPFNVKINVEQFSVLMLCWICQRCSHLHREGKLVFGSAGSKDWRKSDMPSLQHSQLGFQDARLFVCHLVFSLKCPCATSAPLHPCWVQLQMTLICLEFQGCSERCRDPSYTWGILVKVNRWIQHNLLHTHNRMKQGKSLGYVRHGDLRSGV